MSDLVSSLSQCERFLHFPADDLRLLAGQMTLRSHAEGEVLVKEGAAGDGMFLVLSGQVRVTRQSRAGERLLSELGAGHVIGLVALVDPGVRSATVTAVGPVEAAWLSRVTFSMLYRTHAPVSFRFQLMIARQLARDARNLNARLVRLLATPERTLDETLDVAFPVEMD